MRQPMLHHRQPEYTHSLLLRPSSTSEQAHQPSAALRTTDTASLYALNDSISHALQGFVYAAVFPMWVVVYKHSTVSQMRRRLMQQLLGPQLYSPPNPSLRVPLPWWWPGKQHRAWEVTKSSRMTGSTAASTLPPASGCLSS